MFRALYYWIYSDLRQVRTNLNPWKNAYYILVIFQALNIVSVCIVLNHFLNVDLLQGELTVVGLALATILAIINHNHLFKHRNEILEDYRNYSPRRVRMGKLLLYSYLLISFSLFWCTASTFVIPRY